MGCTYSFIPIRYLKFPVTHQYYHHHLSNAPNNSIPNIVSPPTTTSSLTTSLPAWRRVRFWHRLIFSSTRRGCSFWTSREEGLILVYVQFDEGKILLCFTSTTKRWRIGMMIVLPLRFSSCLTHAFTSSPLPCFRQAEIKRSGPLSLSSWTWNVAIPHNHQAGRITEQSPAECAWWIIVPAIFKFLPPYMPFNLLTVRINISRMVNII